MRPGRPLTTAERLATRVGVGGRDARPTVYGQAIIILVYVPMLTFTGVEGKMFQPMAMTVIIALVVGLRPVADLRSGDDRAFSSPARVTEGDNCARSVT